MKNKNKMKKTKIGKIEQEKTFFGYSYSVWISEDEAFLTKSIDTARIMSMLAITLNKLGIRRKFIENDNRISESKFLDEDTIFEENLK